MKKFVIPVLLAFFCVVLLSVPALAQPAAALAPLPAGTASPRDWDKLAPDGELISTAVKADSAILMDARTGKVLFEKDADKQRFPASITKIMTCLVALDSNKSLTEPVTAGNLPAMQSDASNIDLKNGETMTFEDLLYGLMLESGNDAANAIAMHVSGSIADFVGLMNKKAKELGMGHSHWANTNGLHDDNHYTTARDMALLASAAMKYPEFVKIVGTYSYTMAPTNMHSKSRVWENHNKLIDPSKNDPFGYKYATGVKTGYTDPAGQTLVSSASKDNMSLVAVVLHGRDANEKWTDSITMFEYGFQFYDTVDLVQLLAGQTIPVQVKNAAASDAGQGKLDLILKPQSSQDNTASITDVKEEIQKLKDDPSLFERSVSLTKDTAPIKKDDVVGTVAFSYNGSVVLTCDLIAPRDVNEMPPSTPTPSAANSKTAKPGASVGNASAKPGASNGASEGGGIGSVFIWIGVILLALLAAMVAIRFVNMQRRSKKYRQYNYRQNGNTKLRR